MHTTIHDGVLDDHVKEYGDVLHRLAVAFNVTPDELEARFHAAGLFVMCGSPEQPWNVGIRRLPQTLMQRRLQHGR